MSFELTTLIKNPNDLFETLLDLTIKHNIDSNQANKLLIQFSAFFITNALTTNYYDNAIKLDPTFQEAWFNKGNSMILFHKS